MNYIPIKKLRKTVESMIVIKNNESMIMKTCMNEFLPTPDVYHFQDHYRRHRNLYKRLLFLTSYKK